MAYTQSMMQSMDNNYSGQQGYSQQNMYMENNPFAANLPKGTSYNGEQKPPTQEQSGVTTSLNYDGADKVYLRKAAGKIWNDPSLSSWPREDYRVFCGDLGNEVTDELLTQSFKQYKSFQHARVVRDKKTGKTKGYGFVSFGDPYDLLKALKEMNRRYVGNRPIRVTKSKWRERNVDSDKNQKLNTILITSENSSKTLKKFKKFKPVTGGKAKSAQQNASVRRPYRGMYRGPHGIRPNTAALDPTGHRGGAALD